MHIRRRLTNTSKRLAYQLPRVCTSLLSIKGRHDCKGARLKAYEARNKLVSLFVVHGTHYLYLYRRTMESVQPALYTRANRRSIRAAIYKTDRCFCTFRKTQNLRQAGIQGLAPIMADQETNEIQIFLLHSSSRFPTRTKRQSYANLHRYVQTQH